MSCFVVLNHGVQKSGVHFCVVLIAGLSIVATDRASTKIRDPARFPVLTRSRSSRFRRADPECFIAYLAVEKTTAVESKTPIAH